MNDDLLDWLEFDDKTESGHVQVERHDATHTLITLWLKCSNGTWAMYPLIFSDADGDDIGDVLEAQIHAHHANQPPGPPPLRTSREW